MARNIAFLYFAVAEKGLGAAGFSGDSDTRRLIAL
jgi:hypothetical protein